MTKMTLPVGLAFLSNHQGIRRFRLEEGGGSGVDASLFRALDSPMGSDHNQSDRQDGSWEEQHRSGVEDCGRLVDVLPISRGCLCNGLLDSTELRFHFGKERVRLSQQEVEICHTEEISPIDPQQLGGKSRTIKSCNIQS